jgi:hypothetical protein
MKRIRPEEQWAADLIAATLNAQVTVHDDNSQNGMFDLEIAEPDGTPYAAVEVTAAADADSIELWKLVNGNDERWVETDLLGGWMVALEPAARAKRLRTELPGFLRELEAAGRTLVQRSWRRTETDPYVLGARELGIVHADRSGTDFPGSIYVTIERARDLVGGAVDEDGRRLPGWLAEFLNDPRQADVRSKLARARHPERHAFVVLPGFSTTPFQVADMLWRDSGVPAEAPELPEPVTHAWVVATWDIGSGLRWSPDRGWARFAKTR